MRNAVALLLAAAALAACGRSGGNAQNVAGGLPTPGPRPEAGTSLAAGASFRQRYRDININGCIANAQASSARGDGAPAGSDFRGYCTCTVDGAMEGIPDNQLTSLGPGPREQAIATECARRVGLRTNFEDGGGK